MVPSGPSSFASTLRTASIPRLPLVYAAWVGQFCMAHSVEMAMIRPYFFACIAGAKAFAINTF